MRFLGSLPLLFFLYLAAGLALLPFSLKVTGALAPHHRDIGERLQVPVGSSKQWLLLPIMAGSWTLPCYNQGKMGEGALLCSAAILSCELSGVCPPRTAEESK